MSAGRTVERAPDPQRALDGPVLAAVRAIARVAAVGGTPVYFVGGVPRDLVLARRIGLDVDLVVVGDAMALAGAVRDAEGGRVVTHPRFRTATWHVAAASIDIVTARAERYAHPGALPDITPGTLDDDLARRDFSLNTLAIPITPDGFGPLIDRHRGLDDIIGGRVRVLHARSFIDDPTRIVRAARTEARLGFHMDAETERFAREAGPGLGALSGARLRSELVRLFAEPDPVPALDRLAALGALAGCGPEPLSAAAAAAALAAFAARAGGREDGSVPPDGLAGLLVWLATNGRAGVRAGRRLRLANAPQRDLETAAALVAEPMLGTPGARNSAINGAIVRLRPTANALALAAAVAPDARVRARLDAFADRWSALAPPIDGDDLVCLGFRAGPLIGAALHALRDAWWDGAIVTRDDAIAMARRLLKADGDERPDPAGTVL